MSDTVLVERSNEIVTLTLNRPDLLNAINRELGNTLLAELAKCQDDDDVRVVVLQGSGRAFCAGDDIRGTPGQPAVQPQREPLRYRREVPYFNLMKAIRALSKPVIARVHGYALGAGCDLVLASDFAIAAENARLGLVFVKRAIVGGTYMITKHVGLKKASELLLLGEMIDGVEAARLGMVTRAVPESELDAAVMELAGKLAQGPTRVMGYIKHAINGGLSADVERGIEYQTTSSFFASLTQDAAEGRTAFREKREPRYTGR